MKCSACGYVIGGDVVLWVRDLWRCSACGYVIGGDLVLMGM